MKSAFKTVVEQLAARNVRKTLAIYASSALTAIGVVKLFTEVYDLPSEAFAVVVTILTIGVANAFVYAWHRGDAASQGIKKSEVMLHACFVLLAVILSYRVATSPRKSLLPANASSIAVLPFANLSVSKEDEFFSDGITEDILTQLSKIGDLKVISRTSVMQYKDTKKPLREIGEELGVGSILEGSVRRVGSRVRIVGQLINARSDEHLWAETYDREIRDIFAIQSEVAQHIAEALKATLSESEKARIEKEATSDPEAYAFYLKGRDHYYRYTREENEQAIGDFHRALALDTSYALALAGLGDAYGQRVEKYGYDEAWQDSALALCNKAIAINPNIAEPYKGRGVVYFKKGQLQRALGEYRKAVEINPNYAPAVANLGSIYWWTGKYDEALPWLKRSVALNPTRATAFHTLALLYYGLLEDSLAEQTFRIASEKQADFSKSEAYLVSMFLSQQDFARARKQLDSTLIHFPNDRSVAQAAGDVELFTGHYDRALPYYDRAGLGTEKAFALLKLGRSKDAFPLFDEVIKENSEQIEQGTEEFTSALELARVYGAQGQAEKALQWMQRAIDKGWLYYRYSLVDPLLESLRTDKRFKQMMDDARNRVNKMRSLAKERGDL